MVDRDKTKADDDRFYGVVVAIIAPVAQFLIFAWFAKSSQIGETMQGGLIGTFVAGAVGTLVAAVLIRCVGASTRTLRIAVAAQLGTFAVFLLAPWSEGANLTLLAVWMLAIGGGVLTGYVLNTLIPGGS